MKNKKKIIIISSTIIIIFLAILLIKNDRNENTSVTIKAKETNACNKKETLYFEGKNRNIYLYCLNNVKVNGTELKDLLQDDEETLDNLLKELGESQKFWDGGSEIYKDGGSIKYTGSKITILKCNTIDGNKDIYIGNTTMGYEEGFCKRNPTSSKEFIRTYKILNIAPSNDENYLYLTIRQFQAEEVETVKISKNIYNDYEVNKSYEFTFKKTNQTLEDNIKSIFTNTKLIKVEKTNKVGLEQINESF